MAKKITKYGLKMTEDEFLAKFEEYLESIRNDDYKTFPTKSNFAKWLDVSNTDVIYWCKEHPNTKDVLDQMTADLVIEGMCMKKYQSNAGALALKNLCKWQDNPEKNNKQSQNTRVSIFDEKEAKARVDEYSNNFEARRRALRVAK